ncbi:NADH-quinone oxidoreductase subunit L [Salsipaludibacter albus]|uniref:NADH-quinone oxidoreductase subunit L n=1 Tax=Salsipaludibacter albus TaxID=2849650 RepID=UPI001EE49455|nr:NADH-quinone oxidoreductase subunit L [Salsipaludibacter albus]MBY5161048.1 NADH-quinone oxidoreductase subunit L [Salsipaludibacter albus]
MLFLATEAAEGGEAVANAVVEATSGAIAVAWLIPVLPLLGFGITLALNKPLKDKVAWIPTAVAAVTFLLSIAVFLQVRADQAAYVVDLAPFLDVGGFTVDWAILVDQLTAVMLLVVTGVGTLVHVYSWGYMHGDPRFGRFFAYLNLFMGSMLILVLGSSLLVLFVGWEGVGLSSYLLIGFWFEDSSNASAAKKAFITNRVGDVAFMIAMFFAFQQFGTLDFLSPDGGGILQQGDVLTSAGALGLGLLLLGGAAAKSAQLPLYVWLPDAMAGPTPVSALMHAATMVTAGVYLTVRTSAIYVQSLDAMTVVAWIGALTALLAALIALRQDDIKKILAYSTVSQLGYMFVAVGVGGFAESIFHLVTHAFFKGLLFLAAGSVMHAVANQTDAWRMGGLRKFMPITFWTSAIAWLAISGIPPFAGFFSKDQILTVAYDHGFTAIWAIGVLTAVLTAFYMTRWFALIFLGEPRWKEGQEVPDAHGHGTVELHPHESPASMTGPLVVLGVLSLGAGPVLNFSHHGNFWTWLQPAVAPIEGLDFAAHGPLTEPVLIVISIIAAVLGIAGGLAVYGPRRDLSAGKMAEPLRGPVAELLERKFFVDEAYSAIFTGFGGWVARRSADFDRVVVDGAVNGLGSSSRVLGDWARRTETGLARGYLAAFVLGAVVLAAVVIVQVR